MEWGSVRDQFPIVEREVYLDHASRCPTPLPVMLRQEEFIRFCAEHGRDYASWWKIADNLREKVALLLNADSTEIGFGSSTTEVMNICAQGFDWHPCDNIVTAQTEFPSNVYPWLGVKKKGVEVRFVEPLNHEITLDLIEKCVDSHTRMIALSHIQASNGFRIDLEEIGCYCQKHGIVFCVDATQSLGAFPIDVKSAHIDFLACSTYKWMMGSDGLAIFYCSRELMPKLSQIFLGWSGRTNRNEFYAYPLDYPQQACKFELGNPNFSSIIALDAAMEFHNQLGQKAITDHTIEISEQFRDAISGIPSVRIIGNFDFSHRSAIMTLAVEDPARIHACLSNQHIATALRRDGIRIAPYFYTNYDDVERFARTLRALLGGNLS